MAGGTSAGFILVGGSSSRMGRDKALLPWKAGTLVEHLAGEVQAAAGSVTLVGEPARYRHLGYPVLPDLAPGLGPLGGVCTALRASSADWNLVLACDMPAVTAAFLRELLDAAAQSGADCLLPSGPSGHPEPLCAVYHTRCLPAMIRALAGGVRKVTEALAGTAVHIYHPADMSVFENCNTPEQWAAYTHKTRPEPL